MGAAKRILIIFSLFFCLVLNSATARYKEDYNGDSEVNIGDVVAFLLFGRDNPGDPRADYNGDGRHDITDAVALILNIIKGNLTPAVEEPPIAGDRYRLHGRILRNGVGLAGASVHIAGKLTGEISITDSNGTYDYSGLADGIYIITPLVNNSFTYIPAYREVLINGSDRVLEDFTAVPITPGKTEIIQGITMVSIPPGGFQMGADTADRDIPEHSSPPHIVILDSFRISAVEITQSVYRSVTGTNPSIFKGMDDRPVENVTWYDAASFCNKLSELAGLDPCYHQSNRECDLARNGFRLPAEAEWEYACYAGSSTRFYTGDSRSDLERAGWYINNSGGSPRPVGLKEPNAWGLYDMHGNLSEWCNDWHADYSINTEKNPTGPNSGSRRIHRGGGFYAGAHHCIATYRDSLEPGERHFSLGFRVAQGPIVKVSDKAEAEIKTDTGGTVELEDKVIVEVAPDVFKEDVKIRIEKVHPLQAGIPEEMEIVGTPIILDITDLDDTAITRDSLSDDSIQIAFNLAAYQGDFENLSAAYIASDGFILFFESDFNESDNRLSASIPVNIIGEDRAATAQLQSATGIDLLNHGIWGVLNLQNYYCRNVDSSPLTPAGDSGGEIPVIFVHGLHSKARLQTCETLYPTGSFPELIDYLESKTDISDNFQFYQFHYPAFFEPGYNAAILNEQIEKILPGREDLVFICHGTGGLVVRYYMELLGGDSSVKRLIACGTPHHGSPMAKSGTPLPPAQGTMSIRPGSELINDLTAGESTISSSKYINYAGKVDYPAGTEGTLKIWKDTALKILGGDDNDLIVPLSSAILEGAGKNTVLTGYSHFQLHGGDESITNKDDDPLFKGIYEDLLEILRELAPTPSPVDSGVIQGITMVPIPAGGFQMGSESGSDEKPLHAVILDAFRISRTEVTQARYQAIMDTNPSYFTGDENRPVEQVSWYDAAIFCNRLSEAAGLEPCYDLSTWACDFSKNGFRLPSEAEWEYAVRAGTTTRFYTGESGGDLDLAGWFLSNSKGTTHPDGQKEPNQWGLHDMHGNVWEWCNDWYDENYYSYSPERNPKGPVSGSYRVFRGGSWNNYAHYCGSANRGHFSPDYGSSILGFRICLGAASSPEPQQ